MGGSVISIIVDVALILCFLGVTVFFTKYGLESAIHKLGKAWLSLAITFVISPWITGLLENIFFNDLITNAVYASLVDLVEHNANGYNLSQLFEHLPENFVNFLDSLGASLSALEAEFGSYSTAGDDIMRAMAERIAAPCVGILSTIIGLIIGFLVPFLFFRWLAHAMKDNDKPFFRACDHIGGFLVGAVAGYFLCVGLSLLTKTAFQVIVAFNAANDFMYVHENSFVFRFLTEFDALAAIRTVVDAAAGAVESLR